MELPKWAQKARDLLRPEEPPAEGAPPPEEKPLLGRALGLFSKAREVAASAGWQASVATWLGVARKTLQETASPEGRRDLLALLKLAGSKAQQGTDQAARTIAGVYTRWTGREVSPERVKKVAVQVGVAALAAAVVGALLDERRRGAAQPAPKASGGGWGTSFEDRVSRFFADKGGLNIETHTVDQDGCRLD